MVNQYARGLTRHYALLLGAVAVPLLMLVIALALQQFAGQRRALLGELAGKVHAERIAPLKALHLPGRGLWQSAGHWRASVFRVVAPPPPLPPRRAACRR